jgi:hypothetical protein
MRKLGQNVSIIALMFRERPVAQQYYVGILCTEF